VATLLARVLGTFISGIDGSSLNLSVWRGEVRLTGMQLRRTALESLQLPVRVLRGNIGEVVIRLPWRSIGHSPLVVELHDTTLLVAPVNSAAWDARVEAERDAPAKHEALAAWEAVQEGRAAAAEAPDSFTQRLANGLLKTLEVRATTVHLAVAEAEVGGAVTAGITLASLSLSSSEVDEAASSALPSSSSWFRPKHETTRARLLAGLVVKSLRVSGLVAYLNPQPGVPAPTATRAAETGAGCSSPPAPPAAPSVPPQAYLLAPLDVDAQIEIDLRDGAEIDLPQLALAVQVRHSARLSLTRAQLLGSLALVENLEQCKRRYRFRECLRPAEGVTVAQAPREWWRYASRAVGWERKAGRTHLTTAGLAARRALRLRYTEAYLACLCENAGTLTQPKPSGRRRLELAELELTLSLKDACTFRAMARRALGAARAEVADQACARGGGTSGAHGAPPTTEGPPPMSPAGVSPPALAVAAGAPALWGWLSWLGRWSGSRGAGIEDGGESGVSGKGEPSLLRQLAAHLGDASGREEDVVAARLDERGGSRPVAGAAGLAATGHVSREYVSARVSASIPMVEVTLLAAPGSPIACSQLRDLALDVRVRPGSVGVGVSASVGSLRLLDLSTPWPQLRLVCRAGRRLADESAVEEAGQDGRGAPECDALTLSAETEPLHSSCALLLDVRLAGVRILVNPNLVTSIAAFAAVPPSHWAAVLAIEHSTRRVAASAAANGVEVFGQAWRDRPVNVRLHYSTAWYLLLEPPPLVPPHASPREGKPAPRLPGQAPPPLSLRRLLIRAGDISLSTTDLDSGAQSPADAGATDAAAPAGTEPAAAPAQQRLRVAWEGVCAAALPPGDPDGWVDGEAHAQLEGARSRVRLRTAEPPLLSSGSSVAAAAAPPGGWQLMPFSAVLLLTTGGATKADRTEPEPPGGCAVGTLRVSGALSKLVLRLDRQQLLAAASIALSLACAIDTTDDGSGRSRCDAPDSLDGEGVRESWSGLRSGRCAWLNLSEQRRIADHRSSFPLGPCWVTTSRGWLSYTARDGVTRHLRVADSELSPDGPTALVLTRRVCSSALPGAVSRAGIEWSLRLVARTRSEARLWLSACAAMQATQLVGNVPRASVERGSAADVRDRDGDGHDTRADPAGNGETRHGARLARNSSVHGTRAVARSSSAPSTSASFRAASAEEVRRRQVEVLVVMPDLELTLLPTSRAGSRTASAGGGRAMVNGSEKTLELSAMAGLSDTPPPQFSVQHLLQFSVQHIRCEMCTRLHDARLAFSAADVRASCGVAEPSAATLGSGGAMTLRSIPLLHVESCEACPRLESSGTLISALLEEETAQLSEAMVFSSARPRPGCKQSECGRGREAKWASRTGADTQGPAELGAQCVPAFSACLATSSAGSPDFAASRATVSVDGQVGSVALHVSPAAVQSLCSNGLWVYYQLAAVTARYSANSGLPAESLSVLAPPSPGPPPVSPAASSTASSLVFGRPLDAEGGFSESADLPHHETDGATRVRLPLSLVMRGIGPVLVMLHEDAPPAFGCGAFGGDSHKCRAIPGENAPTTTSSALCEWRMLAPRLEVELSPRCTDYRIAVGSFSVLSRESADAPLVVLVHDQVAGPMAVRGAAGLLGDCDGSAFNLVEHPFADVEVRVWDEPRSSSAVASDGLAMDGFSAEQCGVQADIEVRMRASPMVVVLPAQQVRKLELCLRASMEALSDALEMALDEASAAEVCAAHAVAVQEHEPLVSLSLALKGPLIVLPSPATPDDALLLQLADVELTNCFEYAMGSGGAQCLGVCGQPGAKRAGARVQSTGVVVPDVGTNPDAMVVSRVVCESVMVRISNSRLAVGRGVRSPCGTYLPAAAAIGSSSHRDIFDDIDIVLRLERRHRLAAPHNDICRAFAEHAGSAEALAPPHLHVDLAVVRISLTYSEGVFLASLAAQVLPVFTEEDVIAPAKAGDGDDAPLLRAMQHPLSGLVTKDGGMHGGCDESSESENDSSADDSSSDTLSEDSGENVSGEAPFDAEEENTQFPLRTAPSWQRSARAVSAAADIAEAEGDDDGSHVSEACGAVHVNIGAEAIKLRFIDDSAGSLLPLYEANLSRIQASLVLLLDDAPLESSDSVEVEALRGGGRSPNSRLGRSYMGVCGVDGDALPAEGELRLPSCGGLELSIDGTAELALELKLLFFNPAHGLWEPIVEPWTLRATLRVPDGPPLTSDGIGRSAAAGGRHAHELALVSDQPLELNLTHALLCSLINVASLLSSAAASLAAGDCLVDQAPTSAGADAGTTYAIINLTETTLGLSRAGLLVTDAACAQGRSSDRPGRTAQQSSSSIPLAGANTSGVCDSPATDAAAYAPPHTVAPGALVSFYGAVPDEMSSADSNVAVWRDEAETANCEELVAAARVGDTSMVVELLHRSADVHSVDSRGRGALHSAAKHAHFATMRVLLAANADVEMATGEKSQMRPLHFAALSHSLPCVRLLLAAGANPALADAEGRTPAVLAHSASDVQVSLYSALKDAVCKDAALRYNSAELLEAVGRGMVDLCCSLLATKADPDSADGSHTALSVACERRNIEVVGLLLEAGASVNFRTGAGSMPLHIAAASGSRPIVQALLHAGAMPTVAREEKVGALQQPWALPIELAMWRTHSGLNIRSVLWEATLPKLAHYGWLDKLGTERRIRGERKGWYRRFVLLLPDQLRFFSDYKLRHYRGRIPLASLRAVASPSSGEAPPTGHTFEIHTTCRSFSFCAATATALEPWLHHLRTLAASPGMEHPHIADARHTGPRHGQAVLPCAGLPVSRVTHGASAENAAPQFEHRVAIGGSTQGAIATNAISITVGNVYRPIQASFGSLGLSVAMLTPVSIGGMHSAPAIDDAPMTLGMCSVDALPLSGLSSAAAALSPAVIRRPAAALPAGVLLDVAIRRGQRTLTVRSVVEVVNLTATPIELRATGEVGKGGRSATHCTGSASSGEPLMRLERGEARPLPIALTHVGSEAACRALELRPAGSDCGGADRAELCQARRAWAPLVCDRSGDNAIATCERIPSAGGEANDPTWTCCVSLEYVPLKNGANVGTVDGRARATWASPREAQLARFHLPASEILLGAWPCVLNEGLPAPCWLYLTPSFLCYHAGMRAITAKVRLDAMSAVLPRGNLPSIEVQLDSGKRLIFSGLIRDRDEILRQICSVRAVARQQWASGLALWRPRRVVLHPPLRIDNMLPCAIVVELEQMFSAISPMGAPNLRATASKAAVGLEGLIRSTIHPSSVAVDELGEQVRLLKAPSDSALERRKSVGGRSRRSFSMGGGACPRPMPTQASIILSSGESQPLHTVHLLRPLLMTIRLGADTEGLRSKSTRRDSELRPSGAPLPSGAAGNGGELRGEVCIHPPTDGANGQTSCVLHPVGRDGSARPLRLVLQLRAGAAGAYTVAVCAAHWLRNYSSVDIALQDARCAVLASAASCSAAQLGPTSIFDLPDRRKEDRMGLCYLSEAGVASVSDSAATPRPPSAASAEVPRRVHEQPVAAHWHARMPPKARLGGTASASFSIRAVGHQRQLSIPCSDGSVAQVVVSIVAAGGALAGAGATVVVVVDKCVLRNQTGIELEWAQATSDGGPPLSWDAAADRSGGENGYYVGPLPAGGDPVALRWRRKDEHGAEPLLCVRPVGGGHDWCAAFAPDADAVLKLRPSSGNPYGNPLFIQLTLGLDEHGTHVALLRSATRLPYLLRNDTSLLLAFRQHGADGDWEVLGAGESCAYTWDDPCGRRLLQTHVQDDGGEWQFTAPGSDSGGYAMEQVGGCPDLKLEPQRVSTGQLARPHHETMLLTVGGALVVDAGGAGLGRADQPPQLGWLCATSRHIGFVPLLAQCHESKQSSDKSAPVLVERGRRAAASASRLARTGSAPAPSFSAPANEDGLGSLRPLPNDFPIALERIHAIKAGPARGELLIEIAAADGAGHLPPSVPPVATVRIIRLRERGRTVDRLRALVSSWRASRMAGASLGSMGQLVGTLEGECAVRAGAEFSLLAPATVEPSTSWRLLTRVASRGAAAFAAAGNARREASGMMASAAGKDNRRPKVKAKGRAHAMKMWPSLGVNSACPPGDGAADFSDSVGLNKCGEREQEQQDAHTGVDTPSSMATPSSRGRRLRGRGARSVVPLSVLTAPHGRGPSPSMFGTSEASCASTNSIVSRATELIESVVQDNRERVRALLTADASPDIADARGMTALHWACEGGRTALVKLLTRAGANIELPTQDALRRRPIHLAASCRSAARARATVRYLLAAGVNPTTRCTDGRRAATFAMNSRVQRDLVLAEAEWRSSTFGSGPLVRRPTLAHAVIAGRLGRVEQLLAQRTDPDSSDESGMGALHLACALGDVALAQALLRKGASPNRPAGDKLATRPLHCAARSGSVGCAMLLLEAGADPLRQDRTGQLPLDQCALACYEVRLLLLRATLRSRAGAAARASRSTASALLLHAKVVAQGPLRELRLWDESVAAAHGVTPADGGSTAGNGAGCSGVEHGTHGANAPIASSLLLKVNLCQVGISLVDEEPREVLHLAMRDVRLSAMHEGARETMELRLGHVQLDSSLKHTRFPVVLALLEPLPPVGKPSRLSRQHEVLPDEGVGASDGCDSPTEPCVRSEVQTARARATRLHGDTLRLELCRSSAWHDLTFIEYVRAQLAPLRVSVEENTAARVLRFALTIWNLYEASGLAHGPVTAHSPPAVGMGTLAATGNAASVLSSPLRAKASAVGDDEVYVKRLEIEPVRIVLSVALSPLCHEPELQAYHPTNNLLGLARALVSLHDSELLLDGLDLTEHLFESADVISAAVASHYAQEGVQQLYRILGSLDAFGNPSTVLKDVSRGVFSLRKREKGLKGLRDGTRSFAGGVAGGTAAGALTLVSNLAGGVSNVSGALSLDPWYNERRALVQQAAVGSAGEGFRVGMRALGDGMLGGVAGMVELPIRGAIEGGHAGFWKGAAQGVMGLVTKPVGGIGSFVSKTSEGIAADAKRVTPTGGRGKQAASALRVRQPRVIGRDGVLLPYPRRRLPLQVDEIAAAEAVTAHSYNDPGCGRRWGSAGRPPSLTK